MRPPPCWSRNRIAPSPQPVTERNQQARRQHRQQRNQHRRIERHRRCQRKLLGLLEHVEHQEEEQPDGQRQNEIQLLAIQPPHEGIPKQPQRDWNDPDVHPNQSIAPDRLSVELRTLDRHRNVGRKRYPGRREQHNGMRLPFDPGIRNRQRRRFTPVQRGIAVHRERPVRIVDDHLRDGDRVRPVIDHRDADLVLRREPDALHRQRLDRRSAIVWHSRPRSDNDGQRQQQQTDRHDGVEPGNAPGGGTGSGNRFAAHAPPPSCRSNMLIQPSSANSETCAWNMYSPGSWSSSS